MLSFPSTATLAWEGLTCGVTSGSQRRKVDEPNPCNTKGLKRSATTTAVHDRARFGGILDSSYSNNTRLAQPQYSSGHCCRFGITLDRGALNPRYHSHVVVAAVFIRYGSCNLCRILFSPKQNTMFRMCMSRPLFTEEHSPVPITIPAATDATVPSGDMPPFVPYTKPTAA